MRHASTLASPWTWAACAPHRHHGATTGGARNPIDRAMRHRSPDLLATLARSCDKGEGPIAMSRNRTTLLIEARRLLGASQGTLGEMLGSSRRTGQRWERGGSPPSAEQLRALAALVHPRDANLAEEIAAEGGSTLIALGIAVPPAAPPPAPSPPPPPPWPDPVHLVDTVVCAAAEAMQIMPDAIRPALRAAFRRARLAALTVENVDDGLNPAPATPRAPPHPAGKGSR